MKNTPRMNNKGGINSDFSNLKVAESRIHKYQELKKITSSIEYPVIEDKLVGNTHYFVLGLLIDGKLLPGITGSGPNKALAEYEAVDKAYQFLEKNEWDLTSIR